MTEQKIINMQGPSCPIPLSNRDHIILGHGSGGKLTQDLVQQYFFPVFDNPSLNTGDDGVVLPTKDGFNLVISTDSHVVRPLFFPGGDIGRLAVCGTVNDVAMMGAAPLYLTAGFIIEEGLEISTLQKVISSMQASATEAGVQIVAGDTKVVERGKADGLFINTTGVGYIDRQIKIGGAYAKPGDLIILSGTLGDHGMAVLQAREELGFSSGIMSDIAPLNHIVNNIMGSNHTIKNAIHVLRDPTRGGLATSLNEIAQQSRVCIQIDETSIPIHPQVASACEMLGFDPLYVANEGKMVAIIDPGSAQAVLEIIQQSKYGKDARIIGQVSATPPGLVLMKTSMGSSRVLSMLSGELLPRIC